MFQNLASPHLKVWKSKITENILLAFKSTQGHVQFLHLEIIWSQIMLGKLAFDVCFQEEARWVILQNIILIGVRALKPICIPKFMILVFHRIPRTSLSQQTHSSIHIDIFYMNSIFPRMINFRYGILDSLNISSYCKEIMCKLMK